MMKISSQWLEGRCFVASNGSGHSVVMDGSGGEAGSLKRGVSPMEMLLMGVAGCSSIDVVEILKKQRQDVRDCIATVEGVRAPTVPRVFTEIRIHFKIVGVGVKPEQADRAVQLSAEKYCSASIMLGKAAKVSHSFEIVEAESQ